MKVIVIVEAKYEVEVEALTPEQAERAARENWDTVYRHHARWHNGTDPRAQGGRVIHTRAPRSEIKA